MYYITNKNKIQVENFLERNLDKLKFSMYYFDKHTDKAFLVSKLMKEEFYMDVRKQKYLGEQKWTKNTR